MKLAKAVHDAARGVAAIVGDAKTASGRNVRDVLEVAREVARRWVREAYLYGYEDGVKDALTHALELRPVGTHPNPIHSSMDDILAAHAKGIAKAAAEREAREVAELNAERELERKSREERDTKQRRAIEDRLRGNRDPIGLHSMVEGNRDDDRC